MKRLAVFVEGQTEMLFIERVLMHYASRSSVQLEFVRKEGPAVARREAWRRSTLIGSSPNHFVLIVDCGKDTSVVSDIRDQFSSLRRQGYWAILGLRDLYPQKLSQRNAVREAMEKVLPIEPPKPHVALALLETEAWFIGEHTHFGRVDKRLTHASVSKTLGVDPAACELKDIAHPADAMKSVYATVGKGYTKHWEQTIGIAIALDIDVMIRSAHRMEEIKAIFDPIASFLQD